MKFLNTKTLFFLLIIFNSCSFEDKSDRIANRMTMDFASTVNSEGLFAIGIGGGLDHTTGKYNMFSITFETEKEIKCINEARRLIVNTISDFVIFINKREDIDTYISDIPSSIENVDISIICKNAKPNEIVTIYNIKDVIYYYTKDKDPNVIPWVNIHKETFHEAQKILIEDDFCK